MALRLPRSTLFPYTTLFRSSPGSIFTSAGSNTISPSAPLLSILTSTSAARVMLALNSSANAASDITLRIFSSPVRSEEHTSELQSQFQLVCRLLLEKKNERQGGARGGGMQPSRRDPVPDFSHARGRHRRLRQGAPGGLRRGVPGRSVPAEPGAGREP